VPSGRGSIEDADAFIVQAHAAGLRVLVDLVPNHTSNKHPWFQAALAAAPGSAERGRYFFRDGKGPDGELPPNNWISAFGGSGAPVEEGSLPHDSTAWLRRAGTPQG
jgi:alpha-glucosidase